MAESSDGKRMTSIDWRQEVETVCGPYLPSDTRVSWLARGARRASVTFRQIKALFYGETKDPRFSVAESVRRAAAEARREALELAARYEAIANALLAKDEAFHSADVAALEYQIRLLRGEDRTGDN